MELLAVMAIIGIATVITVPALSSLVKSDDTDQAVGGISLLLEEARAYAMSHNTYVWVGFSDNAAQQNLTVGVVAGTTGDVDDLSSGTYVPVARLMTYDHMSLSSISGLTGMSSSADDIASSQVGTFQQQHAGATVTFTNVLQYSPHGEATIDKTPGISHWIQIGMQPVRGSDTHDINVAVLQVGTLTGQVQIFRQ